MKAAHSISEEPLRNGEKMFWVQCHSAQAADGSGLSAVISAIIAITISAE